MKFYLHKKTGEPLALLNNAMIDVHHSEKAKGYTNLGNRKDCINLCIFPERRCANGIPFHAISFSELGAFKRTNKKHFFEVYPDFGQFRHKNDSTMNYFNLEKIPVRKETFGV